uniref:Uncharacterized protein n=1 Tax=Chromera velia CCMP2878 TaxID=1169474 RepID=A0A0K6SAZ4_9ALVE|eukprot:Cvel_11804.t1-p1 / transcript=Cvel_11804.t1 / gene=Cvel_11804 / organism=Chromera_velia_CCMP2878 / gene_product=hypothetical protein / transcript_product=hypothetical protein / location=Cvel_scaffold751:21708-22480(+) / protein_length=126 / sequence_SO=supercontig / SO=protein_coding / is_pseudo=false
MAPPRPDTSQGVLLNSNGPEKQSFALRSRPSSSPPVRSRQRPRTTTSSRPGLKSRAHSAPGHEKRRGKKVDGGPALKAAVDFLDMQTDIGPFLPVPMMVKCLEEKESKGTIDRRTSVCLHYTPGNQ